MTTRVLKIFKKRVTMANHYAVLQWLFERDSDLIYNDDDEYIFLRERLLRDVVSYDYRNIDKLCEDMGFTEVDSIMVWAAEFSNENIFKHCIERGAIDFDRAAATGCVEW